MPLAFARLFATFFYIGYSPVAAGTTASLAGTMLCLLLSAYPLMYVFAFFALTLLGFLSSGPMEAAQGQKDPGCVVIDEVAGCFVAFFMLPVKLPVVVTTFFLFRAFDMFKICPTDRLEALKGASGIMWDDLIAGFYANIAMQIATRGAGVI